MATSPESATLEPSDPSLDEEAAQRQAQWEQQPFDDFGSFETDEDAPEQQEEVQENELDPEDQENRIADKEILGRSVRVRIGMQEKANEAITNADTAWAKAKNAMTSPLRSVRAFRKNRAENKLARKQARLERKHDGRVAKLERRKADLQAKIDFKRAEEQSTVDGMSSSRLQVVRQEKYDAKHKKRTAKMDRKLERHQQRIDRKLESHQDRVDTFEENKVKIRREKHDHSVATAADRLSGATGRSAERQIIIDAGREAALAKKETALGRKALRQALRSEGARRGERKQIIHDIMKDSDGTAIRDLGRKLVMAEAASDSLDSSMSSQRKISQQRMRNERLLSRARDVHQALPANLETNRANQQALSESLKDMRDQVMEASREQGENSPEYRSALKQKEQAESQMYTLQRDQSRMERQLQDLPAEIARLHLKSEDLQDQYASQRSAVRHERASADKARGALGTATGELLNPTQQPNTDQEN